MERQFITPDVMQVLRDSIQVQDVADFFAMLAAFLSFWAVYWVLNWVWEAFEFRARRRRVERQFAGTTALKKEVGDDDDCAF